MTMTRSDFLCPLNDFKNCRSDECCWYVCDFDEEGDEFNDCGFSLIAHALASIAYAQRNMKTIRQEQEQYARDSERLASIAARNCKKEEK